LRGDGRRLTTPDTARLSAVYAGTALIGIALFVLIDRYGQRLVAPGSSGFGTSAAQLEGTLAPVLIAMLVVLAACRATGALFRRIHQPAVVGEICAGIALGPSLLGQFAPQVSAALFPESLAPSLGLIAQAGVVAFMFLVGLELNLSSLASQSRAAFAISHAGIAAPFLLGAGVALAIYPRVATGDVPFTVFATFMGIAMSVTAFPVLARILSERRLQGTPIGTQALTCAAIGDATAWCLLAIFVGVAQASPMRGAATAYLTLGYVVVMFAIVRPLLARFARRYDHSGPSEGALAIIATLVLLSALATEAIGIHALFGAFLIGVVIPHDTTLARRMVERLENVVVVVVLPMFFAFTGLRTQVGLISGVDAWLLCGLLTVVACAGKFGGTLVAARFTGVPWRESAMLGALMNTRGLMELIVLNIGLDLKIISPALFAMLVLMAVFTTFLTSPLLDFIMSRPEPARVNSAERARVTVEQAV
jgi:Kef-type K+ transport system membrane component KefB